MDSDTETLLIRSETNRLVQEKLLPQHAALLREFTGAHRELVDAQTTIIALLSARTAWLENRLAQIEGM